jgi:cell division protein FtsW (lipid II flippase)
MMYVSASESNARLGAVFRIIVRVLARIGPAWLTVSASLALSLLGLHAIRVGCAAEGTLAFGLPELAVRQGIYLGVGILGAIAVCLPHYRLIGYASWVLYAAGVAMLVFLLIPIVPSAVVRPRNGARSWVDVGPIDLQPSELVKIAYVFALGWYLRFKANHRTLRGLLPPALITAVPVGLIMLQPDLGTALLFIPVLVSVLVAAGARLKHLVGALVIALAAAPAVYPLLLPHQKARLVGLVLQLKGDRSADQDINMQSTTAQRLIGAGGSSGLPEPHARALIRFNALPERHNDMIFAVIVNRFGLVGGLAVLGLYLAWSVGAMWTSILCREPFGRLVPIGFAGFIGTQAIVNIGMNVGLLPIIGITLPFLSHGGSSMFSSWIMTGCVCSIALRRPVVTMHRSFEWEDD